MITRENIVALVDTVGCCIAAKNSDLINKERQGIQCEDERYYLLDLMYKNDTLLRSYLVGDVIYGAVTQTAANQCLGSDWNIEILYSYLKNECSPCCRSNGSDAGSVTVSTPIQVLRGTTANEYIDANGNPILVT